MVKSGEVDKIEIINEKIRLRIPVRKEVIDAKYPKLKDSKLYGINPHFKFTIGDIGNFENKLQMILKAEGFPLKYTMKTEIQLRIGQIISWLLPFLLLIALWLFHHESGSVEVPEVPGGQIFNIGKSKATLFDQNAKVNVTFADVAGLNEAKVEVMEVVDFP
jgi:AFG3 family protein